MKKVVCLILLFCIFTVSLFAETIMETFDSTDDFGEPTGQKIFVMMTDDFTFSNSATTGRAGSDASLGIYSNMNVIVGLLTPYSSFGTETFYDDKISISYKAGDNKVVSFTVSSNDSATFVISGSRFNEILKAMKENNKIQFVVKGTEYEKSTKYNFKFEYDKDELNAKLKEIGK